MKTKLTKYAEGLLGHPRQFLLIAACLLFSTLPITFIAANIANDLDPTLAPVHTDISARLNPKCPPTFLNYPDPWATLGIPPPPYRGLFYPKAVIRKVYRQAMKCWHPDRAKGHPGLSSEDLELIQGILTDASERLSLAKPGQYPAMLLESNGWRKEMVSLSEHSRFKQGTIKHLTVRGNDSVFHFWRSDCPPCNLDTKVEHSIEAAFTPWWKLPRQPRNLYHIPQACPPCNWDTAKAPYTFFFGNFTWDLWHPLPKLAVIICSDSSCSVEHHMPPRWLHEFWFGREMNPDVYDYELPESRLVTLVWLGWKYVLATIRAAFGLHAVNPADFSHHVTYENFTFYEASIRDLFTPVISKWGRGVDQYYGRFVFRSDMMPQIRAMDKNELEAVVKQGWIDRKDFEYRMGEHTVR